MSRSGSNEGRTPNTGLFGKSKNVDQNCGPRWAEILIDPHNHISFITSWKVRTTFSSLGEGLFRPLKGKSVKSPVSRRNLWNLERKEPQNIKHFPANSMERLQTKPKRRSGRACPGLAGVEQTCSHQHP